MLPRTILDRAGARNSSPGPGEICVQSFCDHGIEPLLFLCPGHVRQASLISVSTTHCPSLPSQSQPPPSFLALACSLGSAVPSFNTALSSTLPLLGPFAPQSQGRRFPALAYTLHAPGLSCSRPFLEGNQSTENLLAFSTSHCSLPARPLPFLWPNSSAAPLPTAATQGANRASSHTLVGGLLCQPPPPHSWLRTVPRFPTIHSEVAATLPPTLPPSPPSLRASFPPVPLTYYPLDPVPSSLLAVLIPPLHPMINLSLALGEKFRLPSRRPLSPLSLKS